MSDYSKTTNFTTKDGLSSGDSNKLVKGSEFDTEFDALAVASATKYDSGDLASQAEAEGLTSNTKLLTPLRLKDVLADNGGMLQDIQALADPGADKLLGWDDSVNATISFALGAGLATSTTTINVADAIAGAGLSISSSILAVAVTNGLEITSDQVAIIDLATGVAMPLSIANGTFAFSWASITEITGPNLDQALDGFVMSDAGVPKIMPIDQMGIKVVTADEAQTLAITDANTMQVLTGSTNRIWVIPPNSSVAFEIGTIIIVQNSGTGDLTITAGTGVILDSIFHAAAATAQSDRVLDGGRAALIKTATDTWSLAGNIADS